MIAMTAFAMVFGAAVAVVEKEGYPHKLSGGSTFAVAGALVSFGLVAHFTNVGIK